MPFICTHEITAIAATAHLVHGIEINHLNGTTIVPVTGVGTIKGFTDDAVVSQWAYDNVGGVQNASAQYNSTWANMIAVLPKCYKWYSIRSCTITLRVWNKLAYPWWLTIFATDDPDVCSSNTNMWNATGLKVMKHQRWKKKTQVMANNQLTNRIQVLSYKINMKKMVQNPIVRADDYTWAILTSPSLYGVPTRALNMCIAISKNDTVPWAAATAICEIQAHISCEVDFQVPHANAEFATL